MTTMKVTEDHRDGWGRVTGSRLENPPGIYAQGHAQNGGPPTKCLEVTEFPISLVFPPEGTSVQWSHLATRD